MDLFLCFFVVSLHRRIDERPVLGRACVCTTRAARNECATCEYANSGMYFNFTFLIRYMCMKLKIWEKTKRNCVIIYLLYI
jgi:hypothetical protein